MKYAKFCFSYGKENGIPIRASSVLCPRWLSRKGYKSRGKILNAVKETHGLKHPCACEADSTMSKGYGSAWISVMEHTPSVFLGPIPSLEESTINILGSPLLQANMLGMNQIPRTQTHGFHIRFSSSDEFCCPYMWYDRNSFFNFLLPLQLLRSSWGRKSFRKKPGLVLFYIPIKQSVRVVPCRKGSEENVHLTLQVTHS